MKTHLLAIAVISLNLFASSRGADKVPAPIANLKEKQSLQKEWTLDEFKQRLAAGTAPAIVDLRREEERKEFGYIAESVAVDYLGSDFEKAFQKAFPDKSTPIVLLCAVGARVSMAIEDLTALGYRDLSTVKGSYNAYKASGGKIVPGK